MYVDDRVRVPPEYVKNHEIVLNVGFEATSALKLGNETIEFKARFGGASREISVPVDHVIAIYARENGQGMAFPMPAEAGPAQPSAVEIAATAPPRGALTLTNSAADPRAEPKEEPPRSGAADAPAVAEADQVAIVPRGASIGLYTFFAGRDRRLRGRRAGLAQLVEHPPCKRKVVRSIRTAGTNAIRRLRDSDRAMERIRSFGAISSTGP